MVHLGNPRQLPEKRPSSSTLRQSLLHDRTQTPVVSFYSVMPFVAAAAGYTSEGYFYISIFIRMYEISVRKQKKTGRYDGEKDVKS